MEKERHRRYPSAAAFAEDLARWRRGDPIEARPASRIYRIRRWMGRRRAPLLTALAILVLGGGGLLIWHAWRQSVRIKAGLARGAELEEQGRWREANEQFRLIQRIAPDDRVARDGAVRTGLVLDRLEREREQRRKEAFRIRSRAKEDLQRIEWSRSTEDGADRSRSLTVLKSRLEEAVRLCPELPEGYYLRGVAAELAGDWESAQHLWRRTLEITPEFFLARYRIARLLWWQAYIVRLSDEDGSSKQQVVRLADRAAACFDGGEDSEDQQFQVEKHIARMIMAYARGDGEELRRIAIDGIQTCGDVFGADEFHRILALTEKNREQKLEWLRRALEIRPRHPVALYHRADLYRKRGDWEKAIADLRHATQAHPRFSEAYEILGFCLYRMDRFDESAQSYSRSLEIAPTGRAYHSRGLARKKLGDFFGAILDYTFASLTRPTDATLFYDRGNAFKFLAKQREGTEKRNLFQQAIRDYSLALDLNPNYGEAYINRGNTYSELKEFSKSIPDFDRVLDLFPDRGSTYASRAVSHFYVGNMPQAKADARKALTFPLDAEAKHRAEWVLERVR